MATTIGMELRQYVTITVPTDDPDEAFKMAEQALKEQSDDMDYKEPEIDCMEYISCTADDCMSDRAYEEARDRRKGQVA